MLTGNVYTNTYYKFTYKFPAKWKVMRGPDNIARDGGCARNECRLLMLQLENGTGRVEIRAVPLESGVTPEALLQKAATQEASFGLKPVGEVQQTEARGWKMQRLDLKSKVGDKDMLETLITTSARGSALFITILTDSRGALNDLASGMTPTGPPTPAQEAAY